MRPFWHSGLHHATQGGMLRFMKQLERSGIPWPVLIHAGAGGSARS
jgi:hypothetical protein